MNNENNFIQLTEAILAKIAAGAGTSRDVIFNCSYICPPCADRSIPSKRKWTA